MCLDKIVKHNICPDMKSVSDICWETKRNNQTVKEAVDGCRKQIVV